MPLTQDRMTPQRDGELMPYAVGAGVKIFAGAQVAVNATGYLVPGTPATTLTYVGRADEYVDNTGGADGDQIVTVRRRQAFLWKNSGTDPVDQSMVGQPWYILDDETVAGTDGTGTRSASGTVLAVESAGVWVE
jgi:hypothetical protein